MTASSIKINKIDEECVKKLTSIYDDVIVLIFASSAVDCSAFKDSAAAILFVGFCGEGQNEALINVLTGKTCPSGKLSETFFNTIEDCPVNKSYEFENTVNYDERLYVGYRYADTYGVTPAFAFGHGLSYAKFEYSDLQIKKLSELDYEVSYSIKNTSNFAGKEVSQLYVQDCVCISDRPEKELKGFSKDLILPNETKRITVRLNKRSFAYYLPAVHDFHVENGKFKILVGAASDDIRLSGEITISLPEYTQFAPSDGRYI